MKAYPYHCGRCRRLSRWKFPLPLRRSMEATCPHCRKRARLYFYGPRPITNPILRRAA